MDRWQNDKCQKERRNSLWVPFNGVYYLHGIRLDACHLHHNIMGITWIQNILPLSLKACLATNEKMSSGEAFAFHLGGSERGNVELRLVFFRENTLEMKHCQTIFLHLSDKN